MCLCECECECECWGGRVLWSAEPQTCEKKNLFSIRICVFFFFLIWSKWNRHRLHHQLFFLSLFSTFFFFFLTCNLTSTNEFQSQFLTHARVPEANLASASGISVSVRALVAGIPLPFFFFLSLSPPTSFRSFILDLHPPDCQNVSPAQRQHAAAPNKAAGQRVVFWEGSLQPWIRHQLSTFSCCGLPLLKPLSSSPFLTLPHPPTPAMIPKCVRRWSAFFFFRNII